MARSVIAPDSVDTTETVNHDVTGFRCRVDAAAALARQMLRLQAMEPAERRVMGAGGRKKMGRALGAFASGHRKG